MIIDAHTHIGRNMHINASVDDLLISMDKAKIDKSLVFAGKLNDISNGYLISQIELHQDRLYGVACFHPYDNARTLRSFLEDNPQIVAVKFYTGYDHWFPNDSDITDALFVCEQRGVTAIFHCGDCLASVQHAKLKYAHPLGVDDVAVDYPDVKFVIAHMGYPWHRDAAEVCYKNPNVYADVSGFVYGKFTPDDVTKFYKTINEFCDIAPSEKLLFGSDWPISDQSSYVETCQNFLLLNAANQDSIEKAFNLQ
jgi:predicted TIM-barrel fold metal-dependent hydrolase